jgi:hypothetical protein
MEPLRCWIGCRGVSLFTTVSAYEGISGKSSPCCQGFGRQLILDQAMMESGVQKPNWRFAGDLKIYSLILMGLFELEKKANRV